MSSNVKVLFKIIGMELLLMVFYTANGVYQAIARPSSPVLQFIGLVPLAAGVFIYLFRKDRWKLYFFDFKKTNIWLCSPLLLVLLIIFIGNKGLNTTSVADLLFMFMMQFFIVAFIEETFFRGFMLKMLLSKGINKAIFISSLLFGITHSLQLLGGQPLGETIIQILYAFLVGLVLSALIVNHQSILITITFHAFNNFFNFMGKIQGSPLFAYIIIAILIGYSLFLLKRANQQAHFQQDSCYFG